MEYSSNRATYPIGTTFASKPIVTFNELNYFVNVSSITSEGSFMNCTSLTSIGLQNLVTGGASMFRNTKISYAWMPKVKIAGATQSQSYRAWFYGTSSLIAIRLDSATALDKLVYNTGQYVVCTMPSVPTISSSITNNGSYFTSKLYVPDSLVSSYQAVLNKTILPISQLPTDYPACPWINDLRQKGFIE